MLKTLSLMVLTPALLCVPAANAQYGGPPYETDTGKRVFEALAGENRTDADRARDETRRPVETLEFFGLEKDMTVVELVPGNGWYTAILGPVLEDEGKLFLAIGTERVAPKLNEWGLKNAEVVAEGAKMVRDTARPGWVFDLKDFSLDVTDADMVLTFRNVHNFTPEARAQMNEAAFAALKSGGVYGVVGHTGRHMAPMTAETWRRLDPVLVIQEVVAAGFEFEGYSDLHYRPDDALRFDTTRPSIGRNSDRFTLKFRKP